MVAIGQPHRRVEFDNLKVALVSGVIMLHAVLTYADAGDWFYQEKNLGEVATILVLLPGLVGALFAMGLFFLMAGLFSAPSLERKGPGRFAADRAVRLGLPVLAYIVVVTPVVNALVAYQTEDLDRPVLPFVGHLMTHLDTGPVWFVAVLLIFSLGYAMVRLLMPRRDRPPEPLQVRHLVVLAVGIAMVSFVLRLQFSMDSHQVMNLHVFQWPQHLSLFAFGALGAERGWLDTVPDDLRRGCGRVASVAIVALPVVMALGGAFAEDASDDAFGGGWHWESLATAAIEGALAVSGSIWLLGWFARRWTHQGPIGRAASRAAYGAFLLQTPVLVGAALVLRPLAMVPELKLLVLVPLAVVGSFLLSGLVIRLWAAVGGARTAPAADLRSAVGHGDGR